MTQGVGAVERELLLTSRAADFLAAGPADVVELIGQVCQIPGVPRFVAEHMATALFAGRPTFVRDADGRWRLAALEELAAPVHAPAGTLDMDLLDTLSYVVVDVETTGGRPEHGDRITEIAAVVVRGGLIAETFETLVNPERSIPPMITRLTNISWEMVRDKPPFRDVCERLLAHLEGHIFVAHNATFDWNFVAAEVRRAVGRQLRGNRLCTVRLARRLLPQLPRRSLDWVTRHYGIEIAARHRAAGDAVATAHVLLRLLRDARSTHGIERWSDLERLLAARTGAAKRSRRRSAMPRPVQGDPTA